MEQWLRRMDPGRRASDCRWLGGRKAREGAGRGSPLGPGRPLRHRQCVSRLCPLPACAGVVAGICTCECGCKARVRLGSGFVTF